MRDDQRRHGIDRPLGMDAIVLRRTIVQTPLPCEQNMMILFLDSVGKGVLRDVRGRRHRAR